MRYQQPQNGPAKLTQQTAIARGLTFAYAGSGKRQEYAFGDVASNLGSGATIVDTANGQALRFSGGQATGAATWGKTYSRLLGATSFTVAFLATFASVSSGKIFAKWGGASGNIFLIEFSSSGNIGVIVGDGSSNRNTAATSGAPVSANTLVRVVWTWDVTRPQGSGNGHTIRVNGVNRTVAPYADSNPTSVTSVTANTTSDWQLGVANDGTPMNGDIIAFNVWRNTVLNSDEQIDWSANPWQVYDDDVPDFPWPVSTPTSPAITGVSATTAAGSVVAQVSATLALTGIGATGAVGNVSPSGASSLALSGVGATTAVGSLGVQVDATRALTGVEATTAAGTVTASAISGLTLSGVQAAAAVGTMVSSMLIPRALTGVGATALVGSVTATAGSALSLSGVQGNTSVGSVGVIAPPVSASPISLLVYYFLTRRRG